MVLGRLKKLLEPKEKGVVVVVEDASVDPEVQRAAIASYAVSRGIKVVETIKGSREEVARRLLESKVEGKILVFDPSLLGEDVVRKLEERGVKVVKARIEGQEGPRLGC